MSDHEAETQRFSRLHAAATAALSAPFAAIEAVFALAVAAFVLAQQGPRSVAWAVLTALVEGFISAVRLLAVDVGGSAVDGVATCVKVALVAAPAVRLFTYARRHRLAWVPLYAFAFILALPMLFPAIATVTMWMALVVASALGWLLARPKPSRRSAGALRLFAIGPLLVAYAPITSHSPLGDRVWTPDRLAPRCQRNDGQRPEGFIPEMAVTRYFGVTVFSPELLLLTGERGSWWVRRRADGTYAFEQRSRLSGNLWEGCAYGASVWLTKRGKLFRVARNDGREQIDEFDLPDPPGLGKELDFADAICDADAHTIYASELLHGGLRSLSLDDGAIGRRQLGGLNLQLVRRDDGLFVGIDTARFFVYDPRADRMVEEHPAGIATLGVDLCRRDGAAVVTDLAGRIRLFSRGPSGGYAFERGAALPAPRRVAFARDCDTIAVTSGDDRTVVLLRRSDLSEVRRWSVGPALRDLTFVREGELAVADACGLTILPAAP